VLWLSLICTLSCASTAPDPDARVASPPQSRQTSGRPAQQDEPTVLEDVVVAGRWGAASVTPEIELNGAQIDAFGAYDIGEAIDRIGESLGLDEDPILIINGRRVVNPSDFLGFPPDALQRVEVLPQQANSTYGGDPSQRVVNLVLQRRFRGADGRLGGGGPTAGGRTSLSLDARMSSLADTNVNQYGVQASRDTALYGAEREDYARDHPDRTGVTLRPAVDAIGANFSLRRDIGDWTSSIGGQAQTRTDRSVARFADQLVENRRQGDSLSLSGGLGGEAAGWRVRLGLDGQASRDRQQGLVDLRARSFSTTANLGADRTVLELPAGPMMVNLTARYGRFRSTTDNGAARTSRSSETLDLGGLLTIPLSRNGSGPSILGDTSLTLGGTQRESDGRSGETVSAGLFWGPTRKLKFNGQWTWTTESPSAQQRFEPFFFGEPRTVFDFVRGEAVEVLPLLGGNPDLREQTSDRFGLVTTIGPFTSWQILGGLNFQRANAKDGIGRLPAPTPELEALFPDRFQRDANGRLIIIDQRPINLAASTTESLAANLNFNLPMGARAVRVSLTHNWQLTNRMTLVSGLPELDRLSGDGGGTPRHQLSLTFDGRFGRLGANASARWRSASRIRREIGRDGPDDLRLDDFTTIDLKLSYLFEDAAPASGEGGRRRDDGLRLALSIDNLFDARPGARLGDGRLAPGYGRDDQDPMGRAVSVTLSRRF
jgi:hypothetical protein